MARNYFSNLNQKLFFKSESEPHFQTSSYAASLGAKKKMEASRENGEKMFWEN